MKKIIALMIIILIFNNSITDSWAEDNPSPLCTEHNRILQELKQELNLPFKVLARNSKIAIKQELEKIQQTIKELQERLSQPLKLLQEQKVMTPFLIDSFKDALLKTQKAGTQSNKTIIYNARIKLQNAFIDQMLKLDNLYMQINQAQLSSNNMKAISKKARQEEKELLSIKKKQLFSDGMLLEYAKEQIKESTTLLRNELTRLEKMLASESLLFLEAKLRTQKLIKQYQKQYSEYEKHLQAQSAKPLVKKVKINILHQIQNELAKARDENCLIHY